MFTHRTVLCIAKEWKDPTSVDVTVSSPEPTLVPSETRQVLFPGLIMTVTLPRIREVLNSSHGAESDYPQFIEVFFSPSRIQLIYYLP
jgi:hypothetical protein